MSDAPDSPTPATIGPRELEGTIDLLGVIAYGAIKGFTSIAADAEMARDLDLKRALAGMAAKEFRGHELLVDHIGELGGTPTEAMEPFREAFDAYHDRTRPRDLLEGLVKAYIGDGIASDFYLETAQYVRPGTAAIIQQATADHRDVDVIVAAVRRGIEADSRRAGPLALWGRRLMGEALTQGQVVASRRETLGDLVLGRSHDRPGATIEEIGELMQRLTDQHQVRMRRLGLAP
ncbi:ferritin-like fold-containing protein [Janibacter corallicola]|uniref:ferritin-like fold-containing protein n=1 Tax=Janibacter corallicola TaxID=415212 RepID=UPI00082E82D0|nr:ferritin-like fold-containing protein [Janibacter corallicola]